MTKHIKEMVNKKFGSVIVVKFHSIKGKSKHAYWLCRCVCGKKTIMRGGHLRDGSIKSCGCKNRERASKWLKKYATSNAHKGSGNPMWVGNRATYSTFHSWINSHNKKKFFCDHCKKRKKLDWAKKKNKKYSRNINDYLCLCRGCHLKYDYTKERSAWMSRMLLKARMKKNKIKC